MSVNRENVVWPAEDGTWNVGFYDFHYVNDSAEDFDPEWDVEYDFGRFNWVSLGHPTPEAAFDAWTGANPGGSNTHQQRDDLCKQFDKMAAECKSVARSSHF